MHCVYMDSRQTSWVTESGSFNVTTQGAFIFVVLNIDCMERYSRVTHYSLSRGT